MYGFYIISRGLYNFLFRFTVLSDILRFTQKVIIYLDIFYLFFTGTESLSKKLSLLLALPGPARSFIKKSPSIS